MSSGGHAKKGTIVRKHGEVDLIIKVNGIEELVEVLFCLA